MKMLRELMYRLIWREKEKGSSLEELPVEILMEILSKLPGKQALICRCVSKTFLSVIESRCFIERYMRDDHEDPPTLLTYGVYGEVLHKLWMCKTSLDESVLKVENRRLWNYSCMQVRSSFHPITSNGLILARRDRNTPYVLNPIRKEVMEIPRPKNEDSWKQPLGFGYDPKGNTHKIISVWKTLGRFELEAEIFTLKETDYKWRSLDISTASSALPLGYVSFSSSTVTIGGYVYWTANINQGFPICRCIEDPKLVNKKWTKHMVLCFSLEMETFEWFSHPAINPGALVQLFLPTDLQGTLTLVDFSSEECIGLWTLRDKARGKWSLDYRFDSYVFKEKVGKFGCCHGACTTYLHVVGTWKEGLLLRIWDTLFCFYLNLKTEAIEYIGFENRIQDLITRDFIIIYTPNYLLRLKTYYDQSRVICACPHAGARLRGRLHLMLTRGDPLAYEFQYSYDTYNSPVDQLIGLTLREKRISKFLLKKYSYSYYW